MAVIMVSCGQSKEAAINEPTAVDHHAINYVSSDSRFVMVFSDAGFRSGNFTALDDGRWPDYPKRAVDDNAGMKCISVGVEGNIEEFAIKRPIKIGEQYKCVGTAFKVERCFEGCASAIIKRDIPLTGGRKGTLPSYMLVDRCSGMLAFSPFKDITNGIPLDAVLLRGAVGILADKNSPGC